MAQYKVVVMLSTSPRDLSSTPCEKAILERHIQVSSQVLVVSIGIQLRVSFTVGPAIDRCFLPCRGAPTYPPRSLNSGRTHFPGSCPASAKRYTATLPTAQQRGPRRSNPMRKGVLAIAPRPPGRCVQGGSRLHHYRMVPAQPGRDAELDV